MAASASGRPAAMREAFFSIWGMVRKRKGTVAADAMLMVTASQRRRVRVTHAGGCARRGIPTSEPPVSSPLSEEEEEEEADEVMALATTERRRRSAATAAAAAAADAVMGAKFEPSRCASWRNAAGGRRME